MDVPRKYTGLRFLALLIKIVAWLVLIFSLVAIFWLWWKGDNIPGLHLGGRNWTGLFFLPFGLYTFLQLYIIGNIISLFTDVEYNTRANATANARLIALVEKMEQRMERSSVPAVTTPPPPPPPAPEEPQPVPETPTEELQPVPQETQPVEPVEETAPPPPPPAEEIEEAAPEAVEEAAPEPEPEPEPVVEPESAPEPEPEPEAPASDEEKAEGN